MNFKLNTLSNGLRVLTVPMPNLESATVAVWVKTGSRMEEKRVNGISHFLEHMTFKGSVKRPSAKETSEAVDAIGGEFNAATSKDWTNFYIKARVANLETAFDVLSDMILNPLLKPDEIEREKGVIIEEINMYEDTPIAKIGDVFEQLTFSGNSLGWDTIGNAKNIKSIKKDDFIKYRTKHYYPENMLVTVVGGITEDMAIKLTEKYFQKFQNSKIQKLQAIEKFRNIQTKPQIKLKTKKTDQAHLILGFLSDGRGYKGRFAQGILATILGGGMSSRLFIEVREKRGLAYSVKTAIERYSDIGYIGTYVGADPKRVDEAIAVVLEQHYGISDSKFLISNRELTKAKEYLKGHLALDLEDTKDVAGFFANQALFLEQILKPEQIFKKVDAVRLDDIYFEAKRLFTPSHLNLAVIGQYNDQNKFEKLFK